MSNSNKTNKSDQLLSEIADRIIESIEAGQVSGVWTKPWTSLGMPTNALTGKTYRGINTLWFWSVKETNGFESNLWATYKQWQELGAQVRKGEKGTHGIKWVARVCKDHAADEKCSKCGSMFPTTFVVFSADQVDGFEPPVVEALSDDERIANAEEFFARVGAEIDHGMEGAFYSPVLDRIGMPSFESFVSAEAYYATLGHETIHWSGSKDRLDRDMTGRFGDESYAMEELIAELGAAMLCGHLGITDEPRPDHAQYLSSWVKVLRDNPRALHTAASSASKAAEFVIELAADREPVSA